VKKTAIAQLGSKGGTIGVYCFHAIPLSRERMKYVKRTRLGLFTATKQERLEGSSNGKCSQVSQPKVMQLRCCMNKKVTFHVVRTLKVLIS